MFCIVLGQRCFRDRSFIAIRGYKMGKSRDRNFSRPPPPFKGWKLLEPPPLPFSMAKTCPATPPPFFFGGGGGGGQTSLDLPPLSSPIPFCSPPPPRATVLCLNIETINSSLKGNQHAALWSYGSTFSKLN